MKSIVRTTAVLSLFAALILVFDPSLQAAGKKADKNKRLASVDGIAITEDRVRSESTSDLEALDLQMLRAKASYIRKEHEALEESLQRLVEEKLLELEAAKQGTTKEQLAAKEIQQKVTEPTAEDIDLFYKVNQSRIGRPLEEVAEDIRKYLKQQRETEAHDAFLGRLEKEHQVIRLMEPLRFEMKESGRPSLGSPSAPVSLVLFSDFQCPYCKTFSQTIKEVIRKYDTKVRLVFRQFPLASIHPDAQKAAEASLCADAQHRFWEMHDSLFQNQSNLKEENLKAQARKLGLDAEAFNSCMASSRYKKYIEDDVRAGSTAGTDGTPTLFINGRYLNGGRSAEEIGAIIDEELARRK